MTDRYKTRWYYIHLSETRFWYRYVGPEWLARFLCWHPWNQDKEIDLLHRMNRRFIRCLCILFRARIEYADRWGTKRHYGAPAYVLGT